MIGNFIACRQTLMRYKILSCSIDWNWPHNILTLFFDEHLVFEGLHLYNSAVKNGKKDIRMVIVFFVIFFIRCHIFRLADNTKPRCLSPLTLAVSIVSYQDLPFCQNLSGFLVIIKYHQKKKNIFSSQLFSCAMSWTYCCSHFSYFGQRQKILIFVQLIIDFQELPGWENAGTNVDQVLKVDNSFFPFLHCSHVYCLQGWQKTKTCAAEFDAPLKWGDVIGGHTVVGLKIQGHGVGRSYDKVWFQWTHSLEMKFRCFVFSAMI